MGWEFWLVNAVVLIVFSAVSWIVINIVPNYVAGR